MDVAAAALICLLGGVVAGLIGVGGGIVFVPAMTVLLSKGQVEALIDEIYRSVVTEGHQLLAERLGLEAKEFLRDAKPLGLPLPPFTSILLS